MGMAKYAEDNIEITTDRHFMRSAYDGSIAELSVCYNAGTKPENIVIDIKFLYEKSAKNKYEDKYIVCRDCGKKFLFTAKAQEDFALKGWVEPKRCKSCRNIKNIKHLMCSSF